VYSGGEILKQKNIARLYEDFDKYRKQMGITDSENLKLVIDRKEMWDILEQNGLSRRAAGYGECFSDLRVIFVDSRIRVAQYRRYPMYKVTYIKGRKFGTPTEQPGKKKVHYRDILKTLVHELVHYRFPKLNHGVKYEKRIREILHGEVFPDMNPKLVPATVAKIEDEDEHNKVYSYLVNRTQMSQT
jgi:hypothetical protein